MPSIVEKSCKFGSLFNAEAALNLLERRDCEHVGDLADSAVTAVGSDSCEDMNESVQQAARWVMAEY